VDRETLIPALFLVTLLIVAVIGIVQFYSIQKRKKTRQDTPLTRASEQDRRSGTGTVSR
jgi:hypothetical protein